MRRLLQILTVALGVMVGSIGRAQAWDSPHLGPWATNATFPCANPPGWYTNTYSYAWYYPWFAYYNYSHGPYANWMAGGGFATYAQCVGEKCPRPPAAGGLPALVTISLPADAKLFFSGVEAKGEGAIRSFATPPLMMGQEYVYETSIEVLKGGQTLTVQKRVTVLAGQEVRVTLEPK